MLSHPTYPPDYPWEYRVGKVHFFGKDFLVNPDVLIPRLETECLVRRARSYLKNYPVSCLIDIGTGSGIIGVSIADVGDDLIFTDISDSALLLARENFQLHFPERNALFIRSDLLSSIPDIIYHDILIVANLPYIKWWDWDNMSADTRYEPELALFGWDATGFELYERLFIQLAKKRSYSTRNVRLMIEFGFDQRTIAEEIISSYGWKYEFFSDYAGIERFCDIIVQSDL